MSRALWASVVVVVAVVGACVLLAVSSTTAGIEAGGGRTSDAADWSTWRGNALRAAVSKAALPETMVLRWVRHGRQPSPAWPASQHKLQFDVSFEPVVAGRRLFVPSMVADNVTAYDTESGRELWRFYADGPVRFAPLVWRDNLYIVSDDGFLYCLDVASGTVRWKLRGGPDARLVLGNDRLVSAWPARGAPVVWEDPDTGEATLYFGASIWPFMGIFLHAVDASTGQVVWTNSGSGSVYLTQQHNSPAFAGVAPQGYLAVNDEFLLVSGGRTVPAVYDRKSGEFLYFHVASRAFGKDAGGYDVSVLSEFFFNHGCMYRLADGEPLVNLRNGREYPGILATQVMGDSLVAVTESGLDVYAGTPKRIEEMVKDRRGKKTKRVRHELQRRHRVAAGWPVKKTFFQAGERVYGCGEDGLVGSIDLSESAPGKPWTAKVDGNVWAMIPGDEKLFVVTQGGRIYCFGEPPPRDKAATVYEVSNPGAPASHGHAPAGGYAMLWGLDEDALARLTALADDHHVIAVGSDARKIAALRRHFDDAGLYGIRVHLLAGEPGQMSFPPYLASRIELGDHTTAGLTNDEDRQKFVQRVFHCLRPYGGTAVYRGSPEGELALKRAVSKANLANAVLSDAGGGGLELRRENALPGSAPWTHQYADVANTSISRDERVKPPLGLLWFGGASNDDILPRHGHGPAPQVIGGRLFIEGPHALRAVDVYSGRLLWQREFKNLGKYYDNTSHQPGANEIGSNYVSLADGIYVVYDRRCLRLEPATGDTLSEFTLPGDADHPDPHWGYIGIYEDLLIAGSTPVVIVPGKDDAPPAIKTNTQYASSSHELVVMNRHSGEVLWRRKAGQVFRHNAIVAGAGMIFCIDAISPANLKLLERRGKSPETPPVLLALDARTGEVIWQTQEDVFGTWLGYSAQYDLLLEAGSPARDRAKDEAPSGMTAYRGRDGQRLWHEDSKYRGQPMLHHSAIYTDGNGFQLLNGKTLERTNPITGRTVDWSYRRNYGCNTPIGGQHLLTFRSAAAGFYDLNADAGAGCWGGFRSGCTSNLLPADGILNAPDYTRTCTCSYQNQCSLALVPMDDVEVWTFQAYDEVSGPLARVGLNFGAPGDWPAPDGTLWLDVPSVGGKGPNLGVEVDGPVRYFRRHASEVHGQNRQVTASGVEGAQTIQVPMNADNERDFTVRLYFSEPRAAACERVFDVRLQGVKVLTGLDVSAEAGGPLRELVKELNGVKIGDVLRVELLPAKGSKLLPVLCGLEAVAR